MRLIDASVKDFAQYVKERGEKIILFGAGSVAKTYVPYIVDKYDLSEYIICAVDNNIVKHGQFISCFNCLIPIRSVSFLDECDDNYCIWITNGEFNSVIEQLNYMEKCENKEVFIAAVMQLEYEEEEKRAVYKDSLIPRIPKIIHYCWFSGKKMSKELQGCVASWSEVCPDYKIIRWDESNYDIGKYEYSKEAYKMQKWGFVPDIVRLDILYKYGGFYFDTDVRILKNLDHLRFQEAFCGRERQGHINFGGGSGCVRHSKVVKKILDFRKNVRFINDDGSINAEASGFFETWPLMCMGLHVEDKCQKLDGINVYSSNFFSPYNFVNGEERISENTVSIHYFKGSWIENGDMLRKQTREKYNEIKLMMEKI